jgi:hypothetical protein
VAIRYLSVFSVICAAFAPACGSDTSIGARSADAGAGGANMGGQGGNAGAGGSAGSTGGAGAMSPYTCSGTWRGLAEVWRTTTAGTPIASITVSPDELEVHFAMRDSGGLWHYIRSTRRIKTAVWPVGEVVPELDAACDPSYERSIDLSRDGLRAYLVCFPDNQHADGLLRIARRPSVGAPFVLDARDYGTVGGSLAISADELVLYTSSSNYVTPGPPRMFTRSSVSENFGAAKAIPGLEGGDAGAQVNMTTPDPSPDGLSLFGSLDTSLVVVERSSPGGNFGAPTIVDEGDPVNRNILIGSPDVSADCKSIYYVHVGAAATPIYTINMQVR